MDQEQRDNLAKLEEIAEKLHKVANLFNLASYEASPAELYKIDEIAHLAHECQKLARM
jgi:hypothetical protein